MRYINRNVSRVLMYRVKYEVDGHAATGFVLATDGSRAGKKFLARRFRLKAAEVQAEAEAGKLETHVLQSYFWYKRINDRPRGIWARDLREVRQLKPKCFIEPCDPLHALKQMDGHDLYDQCCHIWGMARDRAGIGSYAPRGDYAPHAWLWNQLRKQGTVDARGGTGEERRKREMLLRSVRLGMAFSIRLGMEISEAGNGTSVDPAWKKTYRIHGGNLGFEKTARMWRTFGPELNPFTDAHIEILDELCEAYGQDPLKLTIGEMAYIYENGLDGFEASRNLDLIPRDLYFRRRWKRKPKK